MPAQVSQIPFRRILRKSHTEIAYGNRMEIAYAAVSFANSLSADLAEIAYGNRMEIAYAGASFANSDSADFAKKIAKKCAKTKL